MKQRMRSLGRKLELATYKNDKVVVFRKTRNPENPEEQGNVEIPVPIMFRYYHIGRAYDLPQLKNLHPSAGTKIGIDYIAIQMLIQELEQVSELVNDPVMHHFGLVLTAYLRESRTHTSVGLLMHVSH